MTRSIGGGRQLALASVPAFALIARLKEGVELVEQRFEFGRKLARDLLLGRRRCTGTLADDREQSCEPIIQPDRVRDLVLRALVFNLVKLGLNVRESVRQVTVGRKTFLHRANADN